jgi:hypothetical protein
VAGRVLLTLIALVCINAPLLLFGVFAYFAMSDPWMRPVMAVPLTLLLLADLAVFAHSVSLARRPRLVIGKQGLQIGLGANPHGIDFEWTEVSYCHWSHYQPGVLNIKVHGSPAWSDIPLPATRHFVHVPEPYRARVEKAIRAMGKWEEGEPATTASPAENAVVAFVPKKASSRDELGLDSVPQVAIHRPRWKTELGLLGAFTLGAYIVLLCGATILSAGTGSGRLLFDAWLIAIFAMLFRFAIPYWARSPEFSVGKDGIRLPVSRRRAGAPLWVRADLGLFGWDEVVYCRWSRFDRNLLQIQVKSPRGLDNIELPPTRLSYRVAEPYRRSVEKAIRAVGKWAE